MGMIPSRPKWVPRRSAKILERWTLPGGGRELHEQMHNTRSKQIKKKLSKRLKVIKASSNLSTRPEWMVLEVLPVIPPDLRPLVPLEGGRFATSDLNDLYRRVINRNNRLKNLLMLKTPDVIIHNEKRMLQEAVDASLTTAATAAPSPVRAIVPSSRSQRHAQGQAGSLPPESARQARRLLGPFGHRDWPGAQAEPVWSAQEDGAGSLRALHHPPPQGTRLCPHGARCPQDDREASPEVWDILEEVTKGHPVLLNRAPTLHRLSIQAFEPVLIEGDAIRVHPLVCTAYNADFDGDQMAVHVPLSPGGHHGGEAAHDGDAQHLLALQRGSDPDTLAGYRPGSYYLTLEPRSKPAEGPACAALWSADEVFWPRLTGSSASTTGSPQEPGLRARTPSTGKSEKVIRRPRGRVIFSGIWPEEDWLHQLPGAEKKLGELINRTYLSVAEESVHMLDRLKETRFQDRHHGRDLHRDGRHDHSPGKA
jgi:DNA-directed RNA polymerase subunit beta'